MKTVECHVCGTTVARDHAVQAWVHPKDGSQPVKVWLCQFCQDLADEGEENDNGQM